jgi:hypothetical protein
MLGKNRGPDSGFAGRVFSKASKWAHVWQTNSLLRVDFSIDQGTADCRGFSLTNGCGGTLDHRLRHHPVEQSNSVATEQVSGSAN